MTTKRTELKKKLKTRKGGEGKAKISLVLLSRLKIKQKNQCFNHSIFYKCHTKQMLTVKVFGDDACQAFIIAWPFTGVAVPMAAHAGELVIV